MAALTLDTNILVYCVDRAAGEKQTRAIGLVDRLRGIPNLRLSVQVLSEYFSATTRKLAAPLSPDVAAGNVRMFCATWSILPLTTQILTEAMRGVIAHKMSFWDAQIWSSAKLNQIEILLTEDGPDGQTIEGVRFVNPFAPDFEPGTVI